VLLGGDTAVYAVQLNRNTKTNESIYSWIK
jgi:hypothetical protein